MSSQQLRSLTLVRNQVIRPLSRPPSLQTGYRTYGSAQPYFGPSYRRILLRLFGVSVAATLVYTWYQSSHLKKAVDAAHTAKLYLEQTRQTLPDHQAKAVEALTSLQQAVKAYVAVLPGAHVVVDKAFSSINDVISAHAEEANVIIAQAYQEILDIAQRNDKGTIAGAGKILGVLKRCAGELQALKAQSGTRGLVEILPISQPDEGTTGDTATSKVPDWKIEETSQKIQSIPRNLFSRPKNDTSSENAPPLSESLEARDEDNDD